MMNYGSNLFGTLLLFLLWCAVPIAWLVLSVYTLLSLKSVRLQETARAIWALTIVLVPILGAVAYLLVRPHEGEAGVG